MRTIGILAVQGGIAAHADALVAAGFTPVLLRAPHDFDRAGTTPLEGLVLPGGESTAQLKAIAAVGLAPALETLVASGVPVLATCAGLILAARDVRSPAQASFGWLDVVVERNGWGSQRDSRVTTSDQGEPLVLIRAPRLVAVGVGVEVLVTHGGEPMLVRQGRRYGATFHPELPNERAAGASTGGTQSWHQRIFGSSPR